MVSYQDRLNKKYPLEDLELVSFTTYKSPCVIRCNTCGKTHSFSRLSSVFSGKKRFCCHICGKRKYILNKFLQSIKDKYPEEHIKILKFKATQSPLIYKCLDCGQEYSLQIADSLKKRKHLCFCHSVPDKRNIKTKQSFLNFVSKASDWELLTDISNISTQDLVECRCNQCGKINSKTMYDYMRGIRCQCSRRNDLPETLSNILGEEYRVLKGGEIQSSRAVVRHDCGFIYTVSPRSILNGGGLCPKCKREHSQGETRIKNWLSSRNIDFEMEYPVAIQGHLLRFDFFLPKQNLYIEYQGRQHYEPVPYFGGWESFLKRKQYDDFKREFCGDSLLEINYKDFNKIEEILARKFND